MHARTHGESEIQIEKRRKSACYIEHRNNAPGKPPSAFRSHNLVVLVSESWPSAFVSASVSSVLVGSAAWTMSTVKTPPVEGIKATSPRDVENVERSSWANWGGRR